MLKSIKEKQKSYKKPQKQAKMLKDKQKSTKTSKKAQARAEKQTKTLSHARGVKEAKCK